MAIPCLPASHLDPLNSIPTQPSWDAGGKRREGKLHIKIRAHLSEPSENHSNSILSLISINYSVWLWLGSFWDARNKLRFTPRLVLIYIYMCILWDILYTDMESPDFVLSISPIRWWHPIDNSAGSKMTISQTHPSTTRSRCWHIQICIAPGPRYHSPLCSSWVCCHLHLHRDKRDSHLMRVKAMIHGSNNDLQSSGSSTKFNKLESSRKR